MSKTTENNDRITDGNGNKVSHIPNVMSSRLRREIYEELWKIMKYESTHEVSEDGESWTENAIYENDFGAVVNKIIDYFISKSKNISCEEISET